MTWLPSLIPGEGLYGCKAMTFAPDGQTLWTASGPHVRVWSFPSGQLLRTLGFANDPLAGKLLSQTLPNGQTRIMFGPQPQAIQSLALSPDASLALSGDEGGTVHLRSTFGRRRARRVQAHQGEVKAAVFSRDGRYVATGGGDGTIRLWDAKDLALACTFRGAIKEVAALAFSPDGHWIVALGSSDTAIHAWRIPE